MYNKIVVFSCNGIGDAVLATPVLHLLRNKFPHSEIAFVVRPLMYDLFADLPFVDKVIMYEKGRAIWPVVRELWRYDLALCLDFKYRSALIPFLARIPVRAGLKHKRGLFMTHAVERDLEEEQIYEVNNFTNIIKKAINLSLEGDLFKLYVARANEAVRQKVDALFKELPKEKPVVAIAPYSSNYRKDWPEEYYQALIKLLYEKANVQVVVLGELKQIADFSPAADWRGRTTLREMSEVLSRSSLFIGNCSGPLHIAAAVDIPIVAIYGSTSPMHWAPKKNTIVLSNTVKCSPCDGRHIPCERAVCLEQISVEDAFQACCRQLGISARPQSWCSYGGKNEFCIYLNKSLG